MRICKIVAALMLSGALAAPIIAQTNAQDNRDAQQQTKDDHNVDKTQAKADEKEHKAAKSKKVKKAAKGPGQGQSDGGSGRCSTVENVEELRGAAVS
jgi:Ni/Co efflux regulator RcnB